MSDYGSTVTTWTKDYNSGAETYITRDRDNNVIYEGPYKDEADLARHKEAKKYADEYRDSDEYKDWAKEHPEEAAEQEARDREEYIKQGVWTEEDEASYSASSGGSDGPGIQLSIPSILPIDVGSAITPQIDPPPPICYDEPFQAAQPPNSMATGKPKDYPATDSADPISDTGVAEAAAAVVGSGVAVAAIIDNAGGMAAAGQAIAEAAVAAMTEKVAALVAEYAVKFAALPASIPGRIAGYTSARVGKTKSDKDRNGEAYEPVKLSLGDLISASEETAESKAEEAAKKQDEDKKNKKADEAKEKLAKVKDSASKKIAKSAEVIGKIVTHVIEGAEWIQKNVDKEVARVEADVRKELDAGYKKAEKDIDNFCENEGDKIGAKIVEQYNKVLQNQAKDIKDKKDKAVSKAKIKATAAVQKAKLKIFALIGL